MNEVAIAAELLAALEVTVLERPATGGLRLIGRTPDWFARFRPEVRSGSGIFSDALGSAFLENFLVDAESFWASNTSGRLKSGLWTEVGPLGTDFHMEASAVCVGERKILLIEYRGVAYKEIQNLLQSVRSRSLRARESKRTEKPSSR
jgi:hypothetical protein